MYVQLLHLFCYTQNGSWLEFYWFYGNTINTEMNLHQSGGKNSLSCSYYFNVLCFETWGSLMPPLILWRFANSDVCVHVFWRRCGFGDALKGGWDPMLSKLLPLKTTEIPQCDMTYSRDHVCSVWQATVVKYYTYKSCALNNCII